MPPKMKCDSTVKDLESEAKPGRKSRAKVVKAQTESEDDSDTAISNSKPKRKDPKSEAKPAKKSRAKVVKAQTESEDDSDTALLNSKPKRKRKNYKEASSNSDSEAEIKPVKKTKKFEKMDEDFKDKPKKGRKTAEIKSTYVKNKTSTTYDDIDFSCTRQNALGKDWNFKISNWNVDGIRAWMKKGGLDYINKENPDILCLQETKCGLEKLPKEVQEVEGYKAFWHCSEKEGYAGVGLYSKTKPLSIIYGLGDKDHDDEGRMVTAEYEHFYVISVYVPNAGRGLVTLPKRLKWNIVFQTFVKELDEKKPVIVCGDMNVAHSEIDLANPKTNTKNAGFTKEERDGMTEFISNGYVDTYRHFYPDKTQAYTFWTYMSNCRAKNVGWRLDYFLVSERFVESICDNVIRSEVFGSDHCPITLFLNV